MLVASRQTDQADRLRSDRNVQLLVDRSQVPLVPEVPCDGGPRHGDGLRQRFCTVVEDGVKFPFIPTCPDRQAKKLRIVGLSAGEKIYGVGRFGQARKDQTKESQSLGR